MLDRLFQLRARGTTARTEILGGVTTFVTLSYIVFVQPAVLATTGMDPGAVLVATCLASAFATLLMGLWARYPIAVAPAMGHNFYFAFTGRLSHMITRTFFGLLFVGFPVVLAIKIAAQRRALGRSPVVLGRTGQGAVERWFERVSPFGLLFWPAVWLWIALGLAPLRAAPLRHVGLALVAAGAALSAGSVFLMGRAWRIGIDPEQRTELAEQGPYRWIRHPIYSGWLVMLVGHVLVVPHPVIDVAAILTTAGVVFEALREERHLSRTFGERYARYAARTGRFAPRLGPQRPANSA